MSGNPNKMSGVQKLGDAQIYPSGYYPYGPFSPGGVFSDKAHDNLIIHKGFKAIHYRHALNPNRDDVSGAVDVSQSDLSGYVWYDPKELYIVPQNLRWEEQSLVNGLHGAHTMTINYTGYYNDSQERTYIRPQDIILLKDDDHATVMVQELFHYDDLKIQRLKFPVFSVDYLSDEDRRYEENVDFCIREGVLHWINKPVGANQSRTGKGKVLSIVYWTFPYLVVVDTPRVFRTVWSNENALATAQSNATYIPGLAVVKMSWLSPKIISDCVVWPGVDLNKTR